MKIVTFLVIAMDISFNLIAQSLKTGYFNPDEAVNLLPDIKMVNANLQTFEQDSISGQYVSLVQLYQYKDSMYTKTDTLKMPKAVRLQYRQDLEQLIYQIQNWQSISSQLMDNKRKDLLIPLYEKVTKALNDVAKENGYSYVFLKEAIMYGLPTDDLLPLVAKKLNLNLPINVPNRQGTIN